MYSILTSHTHTHRHNTYNPTDSKSATHCFLYHIFWALYIFYLCLFYLRLARYTYALYSKTNWFGLIHFCQAPSTSILCLCRSMYSALSACRRLFPFPSSLSIFCSCYWYSAENLYHLCYYYICSIITRYMNKQK